MIFIFFYLKRNNARIMCKCYLTFIPYVCYPIKINLSESSLFINNLRFYSLFLANQMIFYFYYGNYYIKQYKIIINEKK